MEIELTMIMALEIYKKVTGDDAPPEDRHAIFGEILDVLESSDSDGGKLAISGWGMDNAEATRAVAGIHKAYADLRKANKRAKRKHG